MDQFIVINLYSPPNYLLINDVNSRIQRYDIDEKENKLVFYFDDMPNRVGWKSNYRENHPISGKFFCMTQKPSAVCKKSYSQCKTVLRKCI